MIKLAIQLSIEIIVDLLQNIDWNGKSTQNCTHDSGWSRISHRDWVPTPKEFFLVEGEGDVANLLFGLILIVKKVIFPKNKWWA